jgi:hypothetical protein
MSDWLDPFSEDDVARERQRRRAEREARRRERAVQRSRSQGVLADRVKDLLQRDADEPRAAPPEPPPTPPAPKEVLWKRRALAVGALLDARVCAARVLASLEAHRSGLGARAKEAYRELHARAGLAEIPAALASRDLDPCLAAWGDLRGRSLAAAMGVFLREQFDQDWWRNPRALTALHALWSRGGRPTALELWHEMSMEPSVELLIVELSRACA